MSSPVPRDCFAHLYIDARSKFQEAASAASASMAAYVLPGLSGAQGEVLSMDVAYLGAEDAESLLIVSSGTHGVEGFCGSACQVALMRDAGVRALLAARRVACLLIHGVNPYGFSHLRRVNEDNIDLNRNFRGPDDLVLDNPGYDQLHELLLPVSWPASAENAAALQRYQEEHGYVAFREAVTTGQTSHPGGLFYGGYAPSWSNRSLRAILRTYGAQRRRIAWIDVHTGLGPYGHGEKIHGGLPGAVDNLALTRRVWGSDVVAAWADDSVSRQVKGHALGAIFDECPHSQNVGIALEFGTHLPTSLPAMRAEQWYHLRPALAGTREQVSAKRALREAFFIDEDTWMAMVLAQSRTAVIQACRGL
ncbi:M14 family metallopeptidase [Bordetella trematum]|uniref:M14 family metallopeptidase n=1 Tax=Bordetella trematum TaxID=123899 RepID=UPI003D0AAF1B